MALRKILLVGIAVAILFVSACGGGGDDSNGGTGGGGNTPSGGIGSTGGTVTGPSGAQVVIPANALSQNTAIEVTQSNSGAPPLPTGVTAVGPMFAFTPHGTTFATPATITVPFDPSQVPAGETVTLYKTNAAQNGWDVVAGATVNGSTMVGQVSSFSHAVAGVPPKAGQIISPSRLWYFHALRADDLEVEIDDEDEEDFNDGAGFEQKDFGPLNVAPPGHDRTATGEVYSNKTGFTYWVEAEAPIGNIAEPTSTIGGRTKLFQYQFFRKKDPNATLRFVITEAWIEAIDNNGNATVFSSCPWSQGNAGLCLDEVFGELDLSFAVADLSIYPDGWHRSLKRAYQGIARLWGWQNNWKWEVSTDGAYRTQWSTAEGSVEEIVEAIPIFNEDMFDYSIENGAAENTDAAMRLRDEVIVEIDISDIDQNAVFMVDTLAIATAHSRRARESFVAARLRDPANAKGLEWEFEGLQVIEPVDIVNHAPITEPECTVSADELSGTIQFSQENYALPEFGNSSRTVRVTRTGGSRGEAIVRLTTSDGTAVAGTHYQPTSRVIYFGDGDTVARELTIPIINDDVFLGANSFNVTLTPVNDCANIGTPGEAEVTILDNETPPSDTFVVGGTVTGLSGTGLVLEEVLTGARATPANGNFAFSYAFQDGASYKVRIATQPTNPIQVCTIANETGTLSSANVTNVAVTCVTPSASGALDATFGSGGRVTLGLAGGARALALQSDGKILALGKDRLGRYNSDGSVDTSFGVSGEAAISFSGATADEAQAVAVQSDGKILVAGFGQNGTTNTGVFNYDFALARYNTDGSLDTTFGNAGQVFAGSTVGTDRAYAVLIQPDGKIVVAGHMIASNGINNDFAVARYLSTGAPDTSFGSGGVAALSISNRDFAYTAALQADGSIVLAGEVGDDTADPSDVGVARFTSAGVPDSTFGTGGSVRIDYSGIDESDEAESIAVQADGKIVVAGFTLSGVTLDYMVARLTTDGSRDTTFGNGGHVITPFGTGQDFARALAIQSDGAIVVAGSGSSNTVTDFGLVRYLPSGALDTSFDGDGLLGVDFFGAGDSAEAIAIQPDSRIVAAGVVRNGSANIIGILRLRQPMQRLRR
jgi:uncharacterized delta-60 repeat protein